MNKINDLADIAKTDLKYIEKRVGKKKPFVKLRKDIDQIKKEAKKGNAKEAEVKINEINIKVANLKNKVVEKENRMKPFYKLVNRIKQDQKKVENIKRDTFKSIDKLKYEKEQDYKRIHDVLEKLYMFLESVANSFQDDRSTQVKYLNELVEKLNQNKEFVKNLNFYLSEKGSAAAYAKTPLTEAISNINVKVENTKIESEPAKVEEVKIEEVKTIEEKPAEPVEPTIANAKTNTKTNAKANAKIGFDKINKTAVANKVKVLTSQYKNGSPKPAAPSANPAAPANTATTGNKPVLDIFGLPI